MNNPFDDTQTDGSIFISIIITRVVTLRMIVEQHLGDWDSSHSLGQDGKTNATPITPVMNKEFPGTRGSTESWFTHRLLVVEMG